MFDLNLPIFPFDSTAITVTTTVWIGVLVSAFFNLRFGWTLSGLVVAGYLTPLLVTRPITAGVIFVEAILTYLIVRAISHTFRLAPYWSSFFGRDRFFFIVVVSVLVRATLDGWLLPWIGRVAVEEWGLNFDYRNNLHSFGLIVVALIANYFWKPGLRRGLMPISICVSLTYLIVNFVLVGFTNFNMGNFHLLYEDVSASLLASPKAYIIVLTTAYLASWINLRYAWDFNGILIPALLGLLWHDPSKICVSVFECLVLYALAKVLLKSALFRNMTMEGARKLVFFFTICFLYRLFLCHWLTWFAPTVELSETFGFGYLLSTLMAIKAYESNVTIRMLKGTGQVSLIGAIAGSLIGFCFYCGPPISFRPFALVRTMGVDPSECKTVKSELEIGEQLRNDKILLYEKRETSYLAPLPGELATFRHATESLKKISGAMHGVSKNSALLDSVASELASINYELLTVQDRYYYLRERSPANGWGLYVIDSHQQHGGLNLEIPSPLDEWATIESGLCLLENFASRTMAIAGAPRLSSVGGASDVTRTRDAMFHVFHEVFKTNATVQIRGLTISGFRKISNAIPELSKQSIHSIDSQMWVRGSLPKELNLSQLKSFAGTFGVRWNESPLNNQLRDASKDNFVELVFNRDARRNMIARGFTLGDGGDIKSSLKRYDVALGTWMLDVKSRILVQGSDAYVPAKIEELLYLDQEVVRPLIQLMSSVNFQESGFDDGGKPRWLTEEINRQLLIIDIAANSLGYGLALICDQSSDESFLAIVEQESERPRGWGTYVFRPGLAENFAVEVPRPLFENRSFEFGVNLFNRPRGSALLIAGAHPRANLDATADVSKASNRTSMFNLVRHVFLRQLRRRPLLIAQARAIQSPVKADVVMATDDGSHSVDQLSILKRQLFDQLERDQMDVAFVDGSEDTAGYELGIMMQATAVQVSQNKEVVSLWLSPSLRSKYREQAGANSLAAQFVACGLETVEKDLAEYLSEEYSELRTGGNAFVGTVLPEELRQRLVEYLENYDVVRLFSIVSDFSDWKILRLVDVRTGQAFLAISEANRFPVVLNLTGNIGSSSVIMEHFDSTMINQFGRSRAQWLEVKQP